MKTLDKARARLERAVSDLESARGDYYRALKAAHEAGVNISALARHLGVSRTRVRQLLDLAD